MKNVIGYCLQALDVGVHVIAYFLYFRSFHWGV
jgi:hypothetical protein